jgi:hypothetical protein
MCTPREAMHQKKPLQIIEADLPTEVATDLGADRHFSLAIPLELFVVASSADTAADILVSLMWARLAKSRDL